VQRIKTKAAAKGDPKLDKDKRFVIAVEISEAVRAELAPSQIQVYNAQQAQYFDKRLSVGQMIDQVCQRFGMKQVTDFGDVSRT